jgi:hypothetical protein
MRSANASGGHGRAAHCHPRSRRGYGSLSESPWVTGKRAVSSGRPLGIALHECKIVVLVCQLRRWCEQLGTTRGLLVVVDLYSDHGSAGSGWCAGAEESRSAGQLKLQQGSGSCNDCVAFALLASTRYFDS